MAPITPHSVTHGACFALAHGAHLLEDAAILYAADRISSSFHISVMAREELGRFNILCNIAQEILGGRIVTAKDVRSRLTPPQRSHQTKLQAGQSTYFLEALLPIESPQDRQIRFAEMRITDSDSLHRHRLAAQYVDLKPDGTWSTPSATKAHDALMLIWTVAGEIGDKLSWSESDNGFSAALAEVQLALPRSDEFLTRMFSLPDLHPRA